MNLKFYRIRKSAKLPVRAHPNDAGMDMFFCTKGGESAMSIPPGTSRVIATGLKVEVPKGFMLEIKNKSGMASKRQLIVGACVIDSGYDGEILINLHNIGEELQVIMPGEKLAQAVLIPIIHCEVEEIMEDTLNQDTQRGKGGFGSTGKW